MSKTIYYPLTVSAVYERTDDGAIFRSYASCADARGAFDAQELSSFFTDFFCVGEVIPLGSLETCKEWSASPLSEHQWLLTKTWTTKDGPRVGYDGKPFPSLEAEIDAELKWSCWSAEEENWPKDWIKLRHLQDGRTLRLSVSSRKECRGGQVDVTRLDTNRWQVEGHFTASWDEINDLADTLGQILIDSSEWETYFGDWDCISQPVEQLKRYLKERYGYSDGEQLEQDARRLQVNDPDAFAESIPFSYHAMDPGVDRDFDFEFEGSVEELMARIDQEEDALIADSSQQWQELEQLFRGEK